MLIRKMYITLKQQQEHFSFFISILIINMYLSQCKDNENFSICSFISISIINIHLMHCHTGEIFFFFFHCHIKITPHIEVLLDFNWAPIYFYLAYSFEKVAVNKAQQKMPQLTAILIHVAMLQNITKIHIPAMRVYDTVSVKSALWTCSSSVGTYGVGIVSIVGK